MNFSVLRLELILRLKEKKLWVISLFFLLSLGVISFIPLVNQNEYSLAQAPAQTGTALFFAAGAFLLVLLVILSPLASAGRITLEKEQNTLLSLRNTPLKPSEIVLGKFLSSWLFIAWIGALALPFTSVALLWGGSRPIDVLMLYLWILGCTFALCAVGTGFSGLFQRTLNSYLATGAFIFFWCAAWPMIGGMIRMTRRFVDFEKADIWSSVINTVFFQHNPFFAIVAFKENPWQTLGVNYLIWGAMGGIFLWLAIKSFDQGLIKKL